MKITVNETQTINVWDMSGLRGDEGDELLDNLMKGRLKDGFQLDDVTMRPKKKTDVGDFVHSVILLFP